MSFVKSMACAAAFVLPLGAAAGSIDLAANGYELSGDSFEVLAQFAFADGGDFALTDGAGNTLGASDPMAANTYTVSSGFAMSAAVGTGTAISYMTGTVEVLLEGISTLPGSVFGQYNGGAVLVTANSDLLTDPFPTTGFEIGGSYTVAFLNDLAPVPLPAGGLLLLSAGGLTLLMRRKRADIKG